MLRLFAILLGIAFIFTGVAGYLSKFMQDGMLFGYLEISTMHNLVHLIVGVLAIMAATRYSLTKLYFKLLGLIFTIVALWSFWKNGDLMIMHNNFYDNVLMLAIGVLSLYLGFTKAKKQEK